MRRGRRILRCAGNMPEISVIMPVMNGGRFLPLAVASVLAQTLQDFELIIVENGSTDGAVDRLEAGGLDPRIRLLRFPRSLGCAGAYRTGVDAARGRYLAMLDNDDVAEPRRLELQHAFMEAAPEVVLLGGVSGLIDGEGRELGVEPLVAWHDDILAATSYVHTLRHSTVMIRRELIERGVNYRPESGNAADRDFFSRAAEAGRVAALPVMLVRYRWHGGNTSLTQGVRIAMDGALVRLTTRRRRLGLPEEWDACAARIKAMERPGMTRAEAHRAVATVLRREGCFDLAALEAWQAIRYGGGVRAWATFGRAVAAGFVRRPRLIGPLARAWVKEPAHQLMHAGGLPPRIQF